MRIILARTVRKPFRTHFPSISGFVISAAPAKWHPVRWCSRAQRRQTVLVVVNSPVIKITVDVYPPDNVMVSPVA